MHAFGRLYILSTTVPCSHDLAEATPPSCRLLEVSHHSEKRVFVFFEEGGVNAEDTSS